MILAILGSRNINNYEIVGKYLNQFTKISKIVSGGAKGVDELAERYAKEHSIPILMHTPEWNIYGKGAGMVRNKKIVDACDALIACWDGQSKGTLGSMNYAKKQKKNHYDVYI